MPGLCAGGDLQAQHRAAAVHPVHLGSESTACEGPRTAGVHAEATGSCLQKPVPRSPHRLPQPHLALAPAAVGSDGQRLRRALQAKAVASGGCAGFPSDKEPPCHRTSSGGGAPPSLRLGRCVTAGQSVAMRAAQRGGRQGAHLGAQRVHQSQSHDHQPRARSSRAAAASPLRPRLLLARPRRADAALGDGQVHASYTFTHGPCESCYCIAHHPARNTQRVTRPGARVARHRRQRARQTRPRRLGRSATSPTRHSLGALPTARSNACDTADVLPDLGGVRRRIAPWLAGAPRRG